MLLKGKTALIAGAGRNNGKAIALAFASEGADLILVARTLGDELKQVAQECEARGAKTLQLLADVGEPDQVERVVQQGLNRFDKVDVLVSVAAIRPHRPFWEFSVEEWSRVFAVNIHSTFYLARALAPSMMARKAGSIVALGGGASLTSEVLGAAVVASKHALYGLIKSLALELGPYGIRANLLALAGIKNKRLNPEWYAQRTQDVVMNVTGGDPTTSPLGRNGTPEEVAAATVFLASDLSSYVTGDRLLCSGGRNM